MEAIFDLKNIYKKFPGVIALNNVSFDIKKGEILGLMGENGAGKSTLIKILAGVYRKDKGEIIFNNNKVNIKSPKESQNIGISVIYQELNLLPNMSIEENLFIGHEKSFFNVFIDKKKTRKEAIKLMDEVGLNCSSLKLVRELSIAQMQMVEVAKALSINSKLIIMDEPTSSLTEREIDTLYGIIKKIQKKGVSVVFVSHKVNEVQHICDRVHILRDGKFIGTLESGSITESNIIQMMVGRNLENIFNSKESVKKDNILEVKNLATKKFLKNIYFNIRKGEIIGFYGLVGSGRTEIMRVLFGIDKKTSGEIFIEGKKINIDSPKTAIKHGMGFVPEDRKTQGLILGMSIMKNISLASLKMINRFGFIQSKKEIKLSDDYIDRLKIKTPSRNQITNNLSGGNQQKVVISKWLSLNPKILIIDEPTRGIDVSTKKEIHYMLSELSKKGMSIIIISSELPEILSISDRIIVMSNGQIKGELDKDEATQERIMEMVLEV